MGRTPVLTRTDLLVSHELPMGNRKKIRLELNVINLFNQKTPLHLFNYLNKGAPGGSSAISANSIDLSAVRQSRPRLRLRRPDPSVGGWGRRLRSAVRTAGLWQTGLQGQFSVKFTF